MTELTAAEAEVKLPAEGQSKTLTEKLLRPVNQDKELDFRYKKFQTTLRTMEERGRLQGWFAGYCNNLFGKQDENRLKTGDIESLRLETQSPKLQAFSKLYGHVYCRPVFVLNLKDFQTLYRKFIGSPGSAGVAISGEQVDREPLTEGLTLIIAAPGMSDSVKHELKHTLDSQERKGRDQVLDEVAAYYSDVIIPRRMRITTRLGKRGVTTQESTEIKEVRSNPKMIGVALKTSLHYGHYRRFFSSREGYDTFVDRTMDTVHRLSEHYSHIEIDRMLMNAKSVDELEQALSEVNSPKS